MKMSDSNHTTVPLYWEKSPTGKGSWIVMNSVNNLHPYLNVEQQTGQVLAVGLDFQVTHAVPSTLVLFIFRAV